MTRQRAEQGTRRRFRNMFSNFQTLHQIETPFQVDGLRQIRRQKTFGRNPQRGAVHVVAIDALHVRHAGCLPRAKPDTLSAAKIDNARRMQPVLHERDNTQGRRLVGSGRVGLKSRGVLILRHRGNDDTLPPLHLRGPMAQEAATKRTQIKRSGPAIAASLTAPAEDARFVAIAGNIGAGKSTLTGFLEKRFAIKPFYEPNDANPYLVDFYGDMKRFAFHSQMYFLSAKFRAHLDLARLIAEEPGSVFVQDRTIYEDAEIFARTLHTLGILSARDYATYSGMYAAIRDSLPRPDLLIYLRCSLAGIKRRIRTRGRPEEQAMKPRYLAALHEAYEDWFARYDLGPTLVIETEKLDYWENLVDRVELVTALEGVLKGRGPWA